jgi:hypothetical protein
VAQKGKKFWIIAGVLLFIIYFFVAARPISHETVLTHAWLSSLDSNYPAVIEQTELNPLSLFPFTLGDHFGYVDDQGRFSINQVKKGDLSLSDTYWAEYGAESAAVEIRNPLNEPELTIEDPRGYPFFLDGKIFIIGREQNSLSCLDDSGGVLWHHDFAAPLTCIDAAAGLVLTGSLDGVAEVLNSEGKRIFLFEPGGSRLQVILGCALSRDGTRIGVISGIDDQRFLLLERFGDTKNGEYKVVYHEFLEDGFRRAVHISFIDQDRRIVFEREGGIGIYGISERSGVKVPLSGVVTAVDEEGEDGLLFVITSPSAAQKRLAAIRLPGKIIMEAPFKSGTAFLRRKGDRIYTGGGQTLASFVLEKK